MQKFPIKSKSKVCYHRRLVGQPALVSSPNLTFEIRLFYCQTVAGLLMWRACNVRTGLSFRVATGPRQRSHSRPRVLWDSTRFVTPPNLEGQVSIFTSPPRRLAGLYPRQWVPFSTPPTTRRATVEIFEPASTQGLNHNSKSKSKLLYDWRFTAKQSFLVSSPLRPSTRDFFFNRTLAVRVLT
jgi:hypothetical protein